MELITESDIPDEFVIQYYEMSVNEKNELAFSFCSDGDTVIPNNYENCNKLSYETIMVHGSHSTIENIDNHFYKLLAFNYVENEVTELKKELKTAFLKEKIEWSDNCFLDIIFDQAIIEVMKQIYYKEMEQTERSLEKAFFSGETDDNKDSTYYNEKEITKRTLKKIEKYRYSEGKKLEMISGDFPEEFKSLKKEVDKTKGNFVSNHYNISCQNVLEIKTFYKLEICEKILKKQIESQHKVSNKKFKDMYMEYDKHYSKMIDTVNRKDVSAVELVYYLKIKFINSGLLEKISRSEWVTFIKSNYNLFGEFNRNKEWTPKK